MTSPLKLSERPDDPWWWIGLKLNRTLAHLDNIKQNIQRLVESDQCGVVADFQSDPFHLSIKTHMLSIPAPLVTVWIGEALYQLRSTLDHIACNLAEQNGKTADEHVEFPIFKERDKFLDGSGHLRPGVERRIGKLAPEQQEFIEREQPFQRRFGEPTDDPLWWLYRLSNYDRHHFLHLVGMATLRSVEQFTPEWFADRYFTRVSTNFGPLGGEAQVTRFRIDPAAREIDPPVLVEVKTNVTFDVAFSNEGPGAGRLVNSTLGAIGERVTNILADAAGIELKR